MKADFLHLVAAVWTKPSRWSILMFCYIHTHITIFGESVTNNEGQSETRKAYSCNDQHTTHNFLYGFDKIFLIRLCLWTYLNCQHIFIHLNFINIFNWSFQIVYFNWGRVLWQCPRVREQMHNTKFYSFLLIYF